MEMAERGVVSGVGNNHYAPDNTISYAEFATMITRSFFNDQISGGDGSTWYSDFMATAEKVGALAGTKVASDASVAEGSINRYDMAQVMYNVMVQKGVSAPAISIIPRLPIGPPSLLTIRVLCPPATASAPCPGPMPMEPSAAPV